MVELKGQFSVEDPKKGEIELGYSYNITNSLRALIGATFVPFYQEVGVKVEFSKSFKD